MKMKLLALFAVFFMVCSVLATMDDSAAASAKKGYLIDHGKSYFHDETAPRLYKLEWKTYWYSKNKRTIVTRQYMKVHKKWKFLTKTTTTIYKVSKTKMRYIIVSEKSKWVSYEKTKLNTRNYYWKIMRPRMADPDKYGPE